MTTKTHKVFKLKFQTPLHLNPGRRDSYEESDEFIPGDSLKAALVAAAFRSGYKPVMDNPDSFQDSIRLSSAFPYLNDHLFLPKPMLPLNIKVKGEDEDRQAKVFKRLQFLEMEIFTNLLNGIETVIEKGSFTGNGKYCLAKPGKYPALMKKLTQERVNLEGKDFGADAEPYLVDRIFFEKEAGLYFLAEVEDENRMAMLQKCLEMLGEAGFGTDKSSGNGFFDFKEESLAPEFPETGNAWMNLGPYIPLEEELKTVNQDHTCFQLVKRGGYLAGAGDERMITFRRNNIYMFSEGSVFVTKNRPVGKIVNLQPKVLGHPAWRDGRPLFIPVKNVGS